MAGIKFDITGDNKNFLNSLNGAQRGVTNAIGTIEKAGRGIESTFTRIKDSALGGFADIAKGMMGLTAMLQAGNFFKTLIDDASKFNVAMKEVSTLSDDVANHLQNYKDKVVDMSTEIAIAPVDAAKALYQIESAGHHGADGLNILRESAKGAIGGVTDTATAADAITTILNAYKKGASEAQHISDLLFTTVRLGKTNMTELGHSISQVAPVAAAYGVSIEDVLAAIASLTKQGTPTAIAIRQVRDAITATTASLGDAAFQGRSFLDAMDDVAKKSQGSQNALKDDLSKLGAINAVLALTGKNAVSARQDMREMQDSAGAAEAAYEKMASTAGTQTTLLRNNIFKTILPIANEMKAMSGEIAGYLNEAFDSGAMDTALTSLEAFIAAYAVYRGLLVTTTAWNSAALGGVYSTQIAELQTLIPLKELDGQADLQAAVVKGTLTKEQALLVASLRGEVEARYEEIMAAEVSARSELKAATAAEVAAQANMAAAEEIFAAAQARMETAVQSGVTTEIETAKEELNTATRLKNTAATELNTATRRKNGAATMVGVTSKNADTAATLLNTGAAEGNATATGILATAKLQLKKAIDAVNSSFLASPLFWMAATIAAVTYAVYKLVTAESAHDAAVRKTNEALEEQKKQLDERKNSIDGLIRTIQDPNATSYQKIKAYDELKAMASDITEAYSMEALATMEAADAQKILNESMDDAEYEELVEKVLDAEKAYKDALKAAEAATISSSYGYYDPNADYSGNQLIEAETNLNTFRAALAKVEEMREEARKAAQEAATPIEIRIQEAKDNEAEKQRIFDFYDDVMIHVDDIQKSHNQLNFNGAQSKLDDYISEVEAELADLHTKAEQNPIDEKIRLEEEEKTNLLNNLVLWKQQMAAGGYTTIPLMFKAEWGSAQAALNAATVFYQNLLTQTTAGGTQSMADVYNEAKKNYDTALTEWKRVSDPKNRNSITPTEYNNAKSALNTAKSAFEAVGGDPDGKQARAAEQSRKQFAQQSKEREEQQARIIQQQKKFDEELRKLQEEADDARTQAAIAAIKSDAERERMEREVEHQKTLKDIREQENDIYKAIYNQRKAAYENANNGKHYELTPEGKDGWETVKSQAEPSLEIIRKLQQEIDSLDPSKLKEVEDTIKNLDLSAFSNQEQQLIRATLNKMLSETATANANYWREEEQAYRQLVSQYQSYTDQRLAIESEYKEVVAKMEQAIVDLRIKLQRATTDEERKQIREQISALVRSISEAGKKRAESMSDLLANEWQQNPMYTIAWQDMSRTSEEVLTGLKKNFQDLQNTIKDPEALEVVMDRIKAINDQLTERNPFSVMKDALTDYEAAVKKSEALRQEIINKQGGIAGMESVISVNKSMGKDTTEDERRLEKLKQELQDLLKSLGISEQEAADATERLTKATDKSIDVINNLASSLQSLGSQIGGDFGDSISNIGGIFGNFGNASQAMQNFANAKNMSGIAGFASKASSIISLASDYFSVFSTINDMLPELESQYEKAAKRQAKINKMRMDALEVEISMMERRLQAEHYLAETSLQKLKDAAEVNKKNLEAYGAALMAEQEAYVEKGSGLKKWAAPIAATIAATIVAVVTYGAGSGISAALIAAGYGLAAGAGAYVATKNIQDVLVPSIQGLITDGLEGAFKRAVEGLSQYFTYDGGKIAAKDNLRVQTRHASFWRGEKTQDLESWVREKWGKELWDEIEGVQMINLDVAHKLLESDVTLVGETRQTVEELAEYAEKAQEFLRNIKDYVNEAFGPLSDNLVDALWTWYEESTDVLDNFREYASETFKKLAQEIIKTMMNTLIFDDIKDKLEKLTIEYATGEIDEIGYLAGMQIQIEKLEGTISEKMPVIQTATNMVIESFNAMGYSIDDANKAIKESLDDISSEFKSVLLDMCEDEEDFSKQITKTMYETLLKRFVFNAPIHVLIDGVDTAFDNLDAYLKDWKNRGKEVIDTLSYDELDSKVGDLQANIEKLKRSKHTAQIASYQKSLDALDARWGFFSRNAGVQESSMSEEQLKAYHSMLNLMESINKLKEDDARIDAQIAALLEQINELENNGALTDEDRATKMAELNEELQQTLSTLKVIAKTYADMSGWTMEQKIDASPLVNLGDELLSVLQETSKGVDEWRKELVEAMTNDLIKEVVYNADFEKSIRDLQEQYVNIMSSNMSAEEKAAAIQQIADAIAALYNTAEEKVDGLKNIVPEIDTSPFDNMRDSILSTLSDIEANAKDFRKSLEKTLVKDLLEKMVLDVPLTVTIDGEDKTFEGGFDEYGKDWNNRYLNAVKAMQEARKSGDAEVIAEAQAAVDALLDEVEGVYTQLEEGADEFRQRLKEIANDTTFTGMVDSLAQSLMDLEGDVEDIANDMKKTIVKKLVEAFMVSDQIKPLLDELQATFNAVMGMENLTPEQRAQMMKNGFAGTDAEGNEKVFLGINDDDVMQRLSGMQGVVRTLMEAIGYEFDMKEGFSDLHGAFISALTDMEGDASTFGKNIGKTMAEQMLDAYIDKTYSEEIAKINEEWADALASGDPTKIETIRQMVIDLYATIGDDEAVKNLTADVKKLDQELDSTFKDMGDSWVSALIDADSTASDFGRQIGQTLVEKIVGELIVAKQLQKYLDDIQKAYDEAIAREGATIESVLAAVTPAINAAVTETEKWKPVIEEVSKRFKELDNSTPLDNIRSTFLSQLMDMKSDTKDFAKSISEILTEAFIDKFVLGEEFDKRLEEWKQEYASIMRGNYSEEDRATLLKQLRQTITTAKEGYAAEAAAIHEFMGTANYADQGATMNMSDKITYEQADQLLGINMAQELTLEQILATLQGGDIGGVRDSDIYQQMYDTSHKDETAKQILAVLRSMRSIASAVSSDGYGEQIFNRLGTTNDYLRAIRDDVKAYLGNIAMYTANLVKL